MSVLPIEFEDKENSPELLAFLQQFGETKYVDAQTINKFRDGINELHEKNVTLTQSNANKLDKVTSTTTEEQVYTKLPNGTQSVKNLSELKTEAAPETDFTETTTQNSKYVSPLRLWAWFKDRILSRTNTWTGNNNFTKNVVITGESLGNILKLITFNNQSSWNFNRFGGITKEDLVNTSSNIEGQGITLNNVGSSVFGQNVNNPSIITFNQYSAGGGFNSSSVSGMQSTIGNHGNIKAGFFMIGTSAFIQTNSVNNGTYTKENAFFHPSGFTGFNTRNPQGIIDVSQPNGVTTFGVSLPFPRMTNAQRLAITSPPVGGFVYQTDGTAGLYVFKATVGWTFVI